MIYLGDGLKYLTNNLKSLTLILQVNKLGESAENLKFLEAGIKSLPFNLENLELFLSSNYLGKNKELMQNFINCMK